MANQYRGEYKVALGGRDLVLRYSLEALANLEDESGKPIKTIMEDLADPEKPSLRVLQKILLAGLSEHHPEMTLKEVGQLGMPAEIMPAVAAALYGKDEAPTEDKSDEPRPQ